MSRGHRTVIGTPAYVADTTQEWEGEAADGFNIIPTHLPSGTEDFVETAFWNIEKR